MTKPKLDIATLKQISDMISEGWDHRMIDLEHKLTAEYGAKFYTRNGKENMTLAGVKVDVVKGTPRAALMLNWANKARRELLKAV